MGDRSGHLHDVRKREIRRRRTGAFLPRAVMPRDPPDEPIAIADMADLFGVTHRTLHFYEEKGLISAGRIGLMRVYGRHDLERMAVINTCREIGMPVAVIQDMMDELDATQTQDAAEQIFTTALQTRKRELTAALSTIRRQSDQIERLLNDERNDEPNPRPRPSVPLADDERRCLELMAEGYSPARLARAMDLPPERIIELEAGIIAKFQAGNRFQAVAKAVLLGIVAS